jgi:diguanylate cyclase (GGDEF)-like protein
VGRRTARWYTWAVGILGLIFLIVKLLIERDAVPELLRGEYLALLAMFAILEINRMPVRAGVAVGFSFVAVVAALLLGGELPALVLNLGGLLMLVIQRRTARTPVFNAGTYILSTASGLLAASYLGYPMRVPSPGLNMTGLIIFVGFYCVANSLLVGIYSVLSHSRGKAADQIYNFGLHLLHIVISASLGTSLALAYRTLGPTNLYFMCVTVSLMAFLISLGSRVAINKEGLFGLYQAASSINEALTLKEVFERAHAFAGSLLDAEFAWLSLPTGDSSDQLAVAYTWAKDRVDLERATAHVMSMSAEQRDRFSKGQFSWIRDPERPDQGYFGWVVAVQLNLGKQFLGEFGVASLAAPVEVSPEKAQLFAVLSSHLSLAVDNALKFERATMLAFTDPLTGLYNYRQFQNLFREAILRAEKTGVPVSLIYVDLDYFRDVNNTYGHQVGDEALKSISQVIQNSCRDKDLVCRPGGDEFTVILPGVSKESARMVAARVKENLVNSRLEVGLPEPLASVIGASIGVSTFPEDGLDVDTLVKRADSDMYASKTEGGRGAPAPV